MVPPSIHDVVYHPYDFWNLFILNKKAFTESDIL